MAKEQTKASRSVAAGTMQIVMWPVKDLLPHPDNPRALNVKSVKFLDLLESIKVNGVLEPLTVRRAPPGGGPCREVLSGHRRLKAAELAGLVEVPVIDKGEIPDDLAYDIVAMSNLHEDLTPLEEGKRAAVWLDKYNEDVQAVAAKLGKSESWVVQHAQIARGLSADWQKEIREATDYEDRPKWSRWTAGHLAVIARLPVSLQAHYLEKVRKDYQFSDWPGETVGQIELAVKLDLLYLAKAPFGAAAECSDCVNRTDRQPLLWAEAVEEATGDKARCLDAKCWAKKAAAAEREKFKAACAAAGQPEAIPISLAEEPKDWRARESYRKETSALKKTFPKLVTADRLTVVAEGTKGAVPAIPVKGGRGRPKKDPVVWVKIAEKAKESGRGGGRTAPGPSPQELAEQKAREERKARRQEILPGILKRLVAQQQPEAATVLYLCLMTQSWPGDCLDPLDEKEKKALAKAFDPGAKRRFDVEATLRAGSDRAAVEGLVIGRLWGGLVRRWKEADLRWNCDHVWRNVCLCGPVFGLDPEGELTAQEEKDAQNTKDAKDEKDEKDGKDLKDAAAKPKAKRASGAARRKKAKEEVEEDLAKGRDLIDGVDPVDDGNEEGGDEEDGE